MPPLIDLRTSGQAKQYSLKGLEDRLLFNSIKLIDIYWAVKNGTTYPRIVRDNAKKYKYFGLFYLKQPQMWSSIPEPQDVEAERSLREVCAQTGSLFATENEGVNARIVENSVPQGLWRRFLKDVDKQFNKS